MLTDDTGLDSRWVRRTAARAAATYDGAARLHEEVGDRLLAHLDPIRIEPDIVLDVGTATGRCARALSRRYRRAQVLAVDAAPDMLRAARRREPLLWSRRRFVCADAAALPFASESVALLVSNTALHWCESIPAALSSFARVLEPDGLLLLSCLGPDTLQELRDAWAQVDDTPHVHPFPDMHDIGDGLVQAGFAGVVMEAEHLTVTYADADGLLRDLRGTGATTALRERRRGLLTPRRLEALRSAYETHRVDGRLPATYEVVYAHAWKPPAARAEVPVDALTTARRR